MLCTRTRMFGIEKKNKNEVIRKYIFNTHSHLYTTWINLKLMNYIIVVHGKTTSSQMKRAGKICRSWGHCTLHCMLQREHCGIVIYIVCTKFNLDPDHALHACTTPLFAKELWLSCMKNAGYSVEPISLLTQFTSKSRSWRFSYFKANTNDI